MLEKARELLLDQRGTEVVEWAVVALALLLPTALILKEIHNRIIDVLIALITSLQ